MPQQTGVASTVDDQMGMAAGPHRGGPQSSRKERRNPPPSVPLAWRSNHLILASCRLVCRCKNSENSENTLRWL
ncbi:hypothetical protein E4U54_003844 [Claviceps lovelessii]|nr:hypothetical protein E4U54_003844 [Claviceps lovelessii]